MNFKNKKASETQDYENYWKLTVEYSDINGPQFINTLRLIINFIDNNPSLKKKYDYKLYHELQNTIHGVYPKADKGSTRKSINQFIKLGFVFTGLKGYREEAKQFLNAKSKEERELIFSEIYYQYATFSSSVKNDFSEIKNINFFLKTLMNHPQKKLEKEEIIGLMTVDTALYGKGYLDFSELSSATKISKAIGFKARKYNQINFFMNFLKYVPGVHVSKDKSVVTYIEDDFVYIKEGLDLTRDQTLFRIMKEKVKQESLEQYGEIVCYLTKKPQKGLVVSHIWPLQEALDVGNIDAAYNPNNSLLLEPNIDAYFDKFDITFEKDKGNPFFGTNVYDHFIKEHEDMKIDQAILNEERKSYLDVHNQHYWKKNI